MKRKLLVDSRIREKEYEYLSEKFDVIKLPLSNDVYDEISGHSDVFYCKIDNTIIVAPNAMIRKDEICKLDDNINVLMGNKKVEMLYPKDVYYNACQIGNHVIGSKYSDDLIQVDIMVNQGYTKCSIAVTGNNSCITTDIGIKKHLINNGIRCTYINENNIKLLDRKGNATNKKGFIGGASFIYDDNFVLFGDLNQLESKKDIIRHCEDLKLNIIDFEGLNVNDYGGAIII